MEEPYVVGLMNMPSFAKHYSYNQLIEEHDVLAMCQQEYLANKDQLDNPQQIVLVRRKGGPREPKIPKWFQSYKQETDARFDKIEAKLDESKMPQWFKHWTENVYETHKPKWFTTYMTSFKKKMINMMDEKLKGFAKLNNFKCEE